MCSQLFLTLKMARQFGTNLRMSHARRRPGTAPLFGPCSLGSIKLGTKLLDVMVIKVLFHESYQDRICPFYPTELQWI